MADPLNAFCAHNNVSLQGRTVGPLSGRTFAAKDIFDIAGRITGAGNPDWFRTHDPAESTAWAVQALLDAGADLFGITACTELTRGIVGDNAHYGTPENPRAPGRVTGGSSSGSASAVAGKVVDFALGSDTNGSITVPASFCGLYGMKPTRGRISCDGVFKQAPRFDTVGWFARDADLLADVGAILLKTKVKHAPPARLLIAADALSLADPSIRTVFLEAMSGLEKLVADVKQASFCPVTPSELMDAHYVIHGRDAWQQLRPWFEDMNPRLAFQVSRMCLKGSHFSDDDLDRAERFLTPVRKDMNRLLGRHTFVCLPSTASVAWPANMRLSGIAESVGRTSMLVTMGTTLGVPQVTIPLRSSDDLPVGLSMLGSKGSDEALLAFSREVATLWS